MGVENFENKRWGGGDQKTVFRHREALSLIDAGKVLDVGCGDGLFLEMLKQGGIEAVGVDISEEGIKKCKAKNLEVSLCDLSAGKLPFSDGEFDYVVMLDVLEHLYFPEQLLREAKRVSKKYVVISVPNFSSLPARIQTVLGNVPENNRSNKGHVFWFNYIVLKKMIKNTGLSVSALSANTFWESTILTKLLAKIYPSLFALSFVVRLEKITG